MWPIAHAGGAGALLTLVTVLAAGVAVVFVGAAVGRIPVRSGDDLVLPLAAVAVVSSASPVAGDLLSDVAAPAAIVGGVLLLTLLACAFGPLDIRRPAVPAAAIALAIVAAALLGPPLADGPWRERPGPAPEQAHPVSGSTNRI